MSTNTITAPAANWTGKTMAIEMSEDRRSFTIDLLKGYWFRLSPIASLDKESYEVMWGHAHETPGQVLCRLHLMDFEGPTWFAADDGCITREAQGEAIEKGIVVAAQMAMNLI